MFKERFGERNVFDLQVLDIKDWGYAKTWKEPTRNDVLGTVSLFFKDAVEPGKSHGHCIFGRFESCNHGAAEASLTTLVTSRPDRKIEASPGRSGDAGPVPGPSAWKQGGQSSRRRD
jgi:hypothetical protein